MWVGYYAGNTHLTATRSTSSRTRPAEEQGALVRIYIRTHREHIQELSNQLRGRSTRRSSAAPKVFSSALPAADAPRPRRQIVRAAATRAFDLKELGSAKSILFRSAGSSRASCSSSNQAAYCVFFRSVGGVRVVLAVRRLYKRSLAGARAMACRSSIFG